MDYQKFFREKDIAANPKYARDDIGTAQLFYDAHSRVICYVIEAKSWFYYNGKFWMKDDGMETMKLFKAFVRAVEEYAGDDETLAKYAAKLTDTHKREKLLKDARSIRAKRFSTFDTDKLLFNCQNGTLDLRSFKLRPHNPEDYITKMALADYDENARCERWDKFVKEIMSDDGETALYMQTAFGYTLSGETPLECFFILHGKNTRNGKSTLCETLSHLFGEYARTIQPQTLSRRPGDGAAPSPDIARLRGARLVIMPEPEKGLDLNISLIKQLTGGDTYTGRFLNENPFEFRPECTFFINANHLPNVSDDTVFASDRVKLIPFERHFTPEERDTSLKDLFRQPESMSGILNWLVEGYRRLQEEGLTVPPRVEASVAAYRQAADIIGTFFDECTVTNEKSRLSTSALYSCYSLWAKDNGYRQMTKKEFFGEVRRRYGDKVKRDAVYSHVVVGLTLIGEEANDNG